MSTIDSKPDSPNKITISEDKKQLSITNPTTHNTVNITTGKTKFINVTAVGPQGQIGPEGAVGGTGTDADISIRNITLGENISGSSTSNIIIGGHITASGNISGSSTSTGSFGRVESSIATITEFSSSGIQVNGNITVHDDILVGEYIRHKGDENTRIYFTDDRLRFQAGGIDFAGMHKKASSPHLVTINNGSNNIDFQIKDNSNNTLFRTDADEQLVKFPDALQISGSSVSTASFGTIQTTTGTIPTLIGNTTFRDNLTVAGNLDIADTIYHTGDSNTKIRFPETDTIAFNTSGLERLRITSDGQISGSSVSTGSFGTLETSDVITVGANKEIYLNRSEDTYIQSMAGDIARVVAGGNQMLLLDYDTGNRAVFGNGTKVFIGSNNNYQPTEALVVDGNISASGVLYAKEFHTNLVSSSIVFLSGSTKFGDSSDDIHQFTGSLDIHDGGITASTDIYLDNFADTAIRFIDGTGGGANNFLKYNEWKQAASAGTTINNTAGTINFDSKGNADVMVISGSNVGIGTTSPGEHLTIQDTSAKVQLGLRRNEALSNGDELGRIFGASGSAGTFQAGITFIHHDPNDGEIRFRQKVAGTNTDTLTAVDGRIGIGTTSPLTPLQISNNGGHTTGNIAVTNSTLDLYNPLEANTDEKGSILTFSDNYEDGSGFQRTIRAAIKGGTDTTGNTADGFLTFYTDSSTANSATERMRIDHDGYVGIGTTSPQAKLQVSSSGGLVNIDFESNKGKGVSISPSTTQGTVGGWARQFGFSSQSLSEHFGGFGGYGANSASLNYFFIGSAHDDNIMTLISSSGNVGIGTTTPSQKLEVVGNISGSSVSASGDVHIGGDLYVDDLRSGNSRGFDFFTLGGAAQQINIGQLAMSASYTAGDTAVEAMNTTNAAMFGGDVSVGPHGNGKLGIGKLIPTEALEVEGSISSSDHQFMANNKSLKWPYNGVDSTIRGESGQLKYTTSHGDHIFRSGSTDLVIFDASTQRVGIGTTSPSKKLEVAGDISASGDLYLDANKNIYLNAPSTADNFITYRNASDDIKIKTQDVYFDVNGVGIGTSTPGKELTVQGDISASGKIFEGTNYIEVKTAGSDLRLQSEGGGDIILHSERNWKFEDSSDGVAVKIANAGHITASGNISASGTLHSFGEKVGIGTASPNEALHVQSDSNQLAQFTSTDNRALIEISDNDTFGYIVAEDTRFQMGGTSSLSANNLTVRTDSGRVGIGTTSPEAGHTTGAGLTINNSGTLGSQTDLAQARISASLLLKAGTSNFLAFDSNEITQYGDSLYFGVLGDDTSNGNISFRAGISGSTNHTTRMFISSSGNIGIGTTSPDSNLYVLGDSGIRIRKDATAADNSTGIRMGVHDSDIIKSAIQFVRKGTNGTGDIQFWVDSATDTNDVGSGDVKMTISGSGNVGIGTTAPIMTSGTGLMISDSTQANLRLADGSDYTDVANSAGDLYLINRKSDGRIRFRVNNTTEAIRIVESGHVGIGSGFSNSIDPKNGLHITGSDGTTSGIRQSRAGSKIWSQEIDSSGRLQWSYRSTEAGSKTTTFTLDDNNNVGIGTGAPTHLLHITGSDEDGEMIRVQGNSDRGGTISYNRGTSYTWRAGVGGASSTNSNIPSSFWGIEDVSDSNTVAIAVAHSTQNVGIGTTNPDEKLEVSSNNPVVKITDTGGSEGSASIFLNESDSFGAILAYQSADNKFFSISTKETTTSQRMTIDRYGNTDFNSGVHFSGSGNVGIGTTSPGEKLEVVGNISGSSTSTGSFAKIMLHYDDLPTSDPSIKGMVYRDGSNNLKISAG